MSPALRRWLLGSGLVVALAATVWTAVQEQRDDGAVAAVAPSLRSPQPSATPRKPASLPAAGRNAAVAPLDGAASSAAVSMIDRTGSATGESVVEATGIHDAFAPPDWSPPAAKVAAAAAVATPPPPPPQAPPLPFVYLGKVIEDGKVAVFLALNGKNYVARAGDVLEHNYKVESIGESAMTFTYLPMKQPQQLALGARQ